MREAATPEARISNIVVLVLGLWLIAWPAVLSHAAGDPLWRTAIGGALVAALAAVRLARPRDGIAIDCVTILIGAALGLSTLLLDASFTAAWVALSAGLAVALLAMCSLLATAEARAWGSSA